MIITIRLFNLIKLASVIASILTAPVVYAQANAQAVTSSTNAAKVDDVNSDAAKIEQMRQLLATPTVTNQQEPTRVLLDWVNLQPNRLAVETLNAVSANRLGSEPMSYFWRGNEEAIVDLNKIRIIEYAPNSNNNQLEITGIRNLPVITVVH